MLVATDIAARGIHVDDVNLVVHVDPPAEHKAYMHRSGRTARAGADGRRRHPDDARPARDVRTLTRQAGIKPQQAAVVPGDALLRRLAGPAAEYVTPAPEPVVVARTSAPRSSGGRSSTPRSSAARSSAPRSSGGRGRSGGAASGAAPAGGSAQRTGGYHQPKPASSGGGRRRSGR